MHYSGTRHYLNFISDAIRAYWDKPALTDYGGSVSYSYGSLATEIARLCVLFESMGIKPGDKVAICARNCSNWAVVFLAIEVYRAVAVSILSEFAGEDIINITNHSDAKVLFADGSVLNRIEPEVLSSVTGVFAIEDFRLAFSRDGKVEKAFSGWDDAFAATYPCGVRPEDIDYPDDNLEDVALINYTSGTTSFPKGVQITYRNLSSNVTFGQNNIGNSPANSVLSILPLAHIFGIMFGFLYQLAGGVHVYFMIKAPTPTLLMQAMKDVRPYMMLTVPLVIEKIVRKKVFPEIETPLMKLLWHTPGVRRIVRGKVRKALLDAFGGKLEVLIIGGAALNADVEKCLYQMRFPYTCGYGMTETSPMISYAERGTYAFRSVGRIVERMEIKIGAKDGDSDGGEILVRGENVTPGYYKNDAATREAIDGEGWFHTGDLGSIDKDGNIRLFGRRKSMILGPSGQNIYPEEIESKLGGMNGVSECLVVDRGGKIAALVRLDGSIAPDMREEWEKATLAELNRHLPAYSRVALIEIREEDFAKTPKNSIKRNLYN